MYCSIRLLFLLLCFSVRIYADPPSGRWVMTFDEECDGHTIDTAKWVSDRTDPAAVAQSKQGLLSIRLPENVVVHDGICHLNVKKRESIRGISWTTAGMGTRIFHQEFGYYEARMRYGSASGLNNAFWLDAANSHTVHYEIDINEGHFPNSVNMTLHNWTGGHTSLGAEMKTHDQLSRDFHVYGLLWTPNQLTWFFDGKIIHVEPAFGVSGEMRVYLSTAVMPWAGSVSSDLDGTSMDIDWVRIYQTQAEPPQSINR